MLITAYIPSKNSRVCRELCLHQNETEQPTVLTLQQPTAAAVQQLLQQLLQQLFLQQQLLQQQSVQQNQPLLQQAMDQPTQWQCRQCRQSPQQRHREVGQQWQLQSQAAGGFQQPKFRDN
ncbi:hypothetical protein DMENIID0001_115110 [Sergentomyia squamirostris]